MEPWLRLQWPVERCRLGQELLEALRCCDTDLDAGSWSYGDHERSEGSTHLPLVVQGSSHPTFLVDFPHCVKMS